MSDCEVNEVTVSRMKMALLVLDDVPRRLRLNGFPQNPRHVMAALKRATGE
jgi:hypothetical protein